MDLTVGIWKASCGFLPFAFLHPSGFGFNFLSPPDLLARRPAFPTPPESRSTTQPLFFLKARH